MQYAGFWTDGKTPVRHNVSIQLDARNLIFSTEHSTQTVVWDYHDLHLLEEVHSDNPIRIINPKFPDQCLIVENHDILKYLTQIQPRIHHKHFSRHSLAVWSIILLSTMSLLLTAIFWGLPQLAGPLAQKVPLSWESDTGHTVVSMMFNEQQYCSNNKGAQALEALVTKLSHASSQKLQYNVYITQQEDINAFATMGNNIVIFEGLLIRAETPDQLAGVLAHEMAHVQQRHPMKAMIRSTAVSVAVALMVGDASTFTSVILEGGELLTSLSYTREDEAEADNIAIDILNNANINATGFSDFFKIISEELGENNSDWFSYFSSHPSSSERAELVLQQGKGIQKALSNNQWLSLKTICQQQQTYEYATDISEYIPEIFKSEDEVPE